MTIRYPFAFQGNATGMSEFHRRGFVATVAAGLSAGCMDVIQQGTGTPKVFVDDDEVQFEPAGATLTGQIAAADLDEEEFADGDSLDEDSGTFTVTGTDTDAITFDEGTLESLAFTTEGDAKAKVFHDGELLSDGTAQFSETFTTPTPTPGQAGVIDDFERSGPDALSAYTVVKHYDDTPAVTDARAYSGERALELRATNASRNNAGLYSTGGLDAYPRPGTQFAAWTRADQAYGGLNLRFGGRDLDNAYDVHLHLTQGILRLATLVSGDAQVLDETSQSFAPRTWYRIVVDWSTTGAGGRDIDVEVQDEDGSTVASVSGTDGTFSAPMIGFRRWIGNGPATGWFDGVRIL